jgi:ABC-type Fe3+/spermidine/putrescine transport system ATPase subunit
MAGASGAFLDVERLSVRYGTTPVLHDLSLAVTQGSFVALLGASGCGKTTLLRTIAGFIDPFAGRLRIAGRDITRLPPDRRGMAMVFQSYALWPHMSVVQNIGYGLKLRRVDKAAIKRKVGDILAMLGLDGLSERNVTALSGGQRQRVALGRALAIDPEILLLDEPLSNLDAKIRQTVRHEIRALQRRLGITAIHVTHDREEAMVMADTIVILDAGRIAQAGSPEAIYNRPASPFVADFMGADNIVTLDGQLGTDAISIAAGADHLSARLARTRLPTQAALAGTGQRRLRAYFRSEAAMLIEETTAPMSEEASRDVVHLRGRVQEVSYPGGIWRHAVSVGDRLFLVDDAERHSPGSAVRVRLPAETLFLFPDEAGHRTAASTGPLAVGLPG